MISVRATPKSKYNNNNTGVRCLRGEEKQAEVEFIFINFNPPSLAFLLFNIFLILLRVTLTILHEKWEQIFATFHRGIVGYEN